MRQFFRFFRSAVTYHQIHSPQVFELVSAVLEDRRRFYAFFDIEMLRQKMLASDAVLETTDYGARAGERESIREKRSLRDIVRRSASSPEQGRQLFRLAQWRRPATMLELGTSTGLGAMYLATGAPQARLMTLEGCPATAQIARVNFDMLRLGNIELLNSPFDRLLPSLLQTGRSFDLVYIDGFHTKTATLRYVDMLLPHLAPDAVLVFDDVHWLAGMEQAWENIRQLPEVTCTIDCWNLAIALTSPVFKEKYHYNVAPTRWKPWTRYL